MDSTKIKRLVNARDALISKLDDQIILLHDLVTHQSRHTKVNRLIGECTNIHFEIADKNEQLSQCDDEGIRAEAMDNATRLGEKYMNCTQDARAYLAKPWSKKSSLKSGTTSSRRRAIELQAQLNMEELQRQESARLEAEKLKSALAEMEIREQSRQKIQEERDKAAVALAEAGSQVDDEDLASESNASSEGSASKAKPPTQFPSSSTTVANWLLTQPLAAGPSDSTALHCTPVWLGSGDPTVNQQTTSTISTTAVQPHITSPHAVQPVVGPALSATSSVSPGVNAVSITTCQPTGQVQQVASGCALPSTLAINHHLLPIPQAPPPPPLPPNALSIAGHVPTPAVNITTATLTVPVTARTAMQPTTASTMAPPTALPASGAVLHHMPSPVTCTVNTSVVSVPTAVSTIAPVSLALPVSTHVPIPSLSHSSAAPLHPIPAPMPTPTAAFMPSHVPTLPSTAPAYSVPVASTAVPSSSFVAPISMPVSAHAISLSPATSYASVPQPLIPRHTIIQPGPSLAPVGLHKTPTSVYTAPYDHPYVNP